MQVLSGLPPASRWRLPRRVSQECVETIKWCQSRVPVRLKYSRNWAAGTPGYRFDLLALSAIAVKLRVCGRLSESIERRRVVRRSTTRPGEIGGVVNAGPAGDWPSIIEATVVASENSIKDLRWM